VAISILGTGSAVPDKVLTNAYFETIVDTSDEWIRTRTGIRERRMADEKTVSSDLAKEASLRALEMSKVTAKDLDIILVANVTGDTPFPSTACHLQAKLGAKGAAVFDIAAACSGFLYGMEIGRALIETGKYKTILLVGVEMLTRITDYKDRNTCVLFGDAAGAVVLKPGNKGHEVLAVHLGSDGSLAHLLQQPGGGSRHPASHETVEKRMHFMQMVGNEVFKYAVRAMEDSAIRAIKEAGIKVGDVDFLIPHQANIRIIKATAKRLKLPPEKVYVNIDRYGNTSTASIPLAMDEANRKGLLKKGMHVVLAAFGGGFTWAGAVIRW
jgi:3-oxoacyl-[acyl-carrier-protein] synthase-3